MAIGIVVGACTPGERAGVLPDADVADAVPCVETVQYVWADLEASSPSGSLATFHHGYAFWEYCGRYVVAFREQPACVNPHGAELTLQFQAEQTPAVGDVIPAYVGLRGRGSGLEGTNAEFTVASFQEGSPGYTLPTWSGRFAVTAPGWNLDFNVEMAAQFGGSCTLL